MPCMPIVENGKNIGFMCGSFSQEEVAQSFCFDCESNSPRAAFLCDYPVGNDKTCDRQLCPNCANAVGPNMHYCTTHHKEWTEFQNSGEGHKQVLNAIKSGKKLTVLTR
ncbi:hypothetical protein [Vibrio sp. OPT18]|uniref:hypothetical protein n=1 Tax=Vibrio sp. OPT18 TaxID=2778641 RepID=UPI001882A46B|nr:hypothetical protein [Vibrio sp. OPT18]MBE8578622.1 hypothetical protein [Vibrio sp. OPT18]